MFASPTVDPVGLVVYAATLGGLVHAIDAVSRIHELFMYRYLDNMVIGHV